MSKRILGEKVFTADEAAKEFHVPATTIRQYARDGRIRGRKIGRAWHFTESALRELVNPPAVSERKEEALASHETWNVTTPVVATEFAAVRPIGATGGSDPIPAVGSGVVDGVQVAVHAAGGDLRIELSSDKASLINNVLRRGQMKVEENPGQFVSVDPFAAGVLARDASRWVFRIELETGDASPRAVLIGGRLIRLTA